MTEEDVFEIEVEYTDSGLQLVPDMDKLREKVREDFGSFESLIDFYQREPGELSEQFSDEMEELDEGESPQGPGIVVTNIPVNWQEDPSELANILEILHNEMVRMGLGYLIENEIEDEQEMMEMGLYKSLIIRQSAFYEDLLKLRCQLALQEQKGEPLSNKEFKVIDNMGHKSRLRLALLLDVVDEHEHGMLQQMASKRNDIAHTAWPEIDEEETSDIKTTAEKVLSLLESEIKEARERVSIEEHETEEFDIGFGGLDAETQNLQLSILDILANHENPVSLKYIEKVLPEDYGEIQQRCWRMNEIGYVNMADRDGPLSITEEGEMLLNEYFD